MKTLQTFCLLNYIFSIAGALIQEKQNFRAIRLTLITFVALKSWKCQLVTRVKNLLKIETPLDLIPVWQTYL